MAKRKRTVAQMLVSLQDATDFPSAFSDAPATYVTQTQAIEYLSRSAQAFAQKTLASAIQASFVTISTAATVAGANTWTAEYLLPDDFAALINITYLDQSQMPRKMRRTDINEIDLSSRQGLGWNQYVPPLYCILGERLITTQPNGTFNMILRYVPEMPMFNNGDVAIYDFSATTDYVLCKGAIDQWIVLNAAEKILIKQQIDPSAVVSQRAELEQALIGNVTDRNAMDPPHVQDAWNDTQMGDS